MTTNLQELRKACEENLWTYARMVNPHFLYADIHRELFQWIQDSVDAADRGESTINDMVIIPRAHAKSHIAATVAAWLIARNPAITILYQTATSNLAETQLYAIKNILTSDTHMKLWPDLINPEEGKRERWTVTEISVDSPIRKREGVRDCTIKTAGLTTTITGLHCDMIIKDDVVVPENAYTQVGRDKVSAATSQLASIQNPGAGEFVFGTRYHLKDHYHDLMEMQRETWDDEGNLIDKKPMYRVFKRVVETDGNFLWPRATRKDGKWFGFNYQVLAEKKAKYTDTRQFYAQYYNELNNPESNRLDNSKFQYYDRKKLTNDGGKWYFNGKDLNVYAAVDFAFSVSTRADYTAIVVIGVDCDGYIYLLDIDRFKTTKMEDYFGHLFKLHSKWMFRKLRAEVTVAQKAIVEYLKDRAREQGLSLSIDEHRPGKGQGSKEERIAAILEPRYENQTIWHYKGGMCEILEEELILERPPHDDVKDCLAMVCEIAVAPIKRNRRDRKVVSLKFNKRFGGVA